MKRIKQVLSISVAWLLIGGIASTPVAAPSAGFSFSHCRILSAADLLQQVPFDPDQQKHLFAETERLAISLKRADPCAECGGRKSFTFGVTDKWQGTATEFTIRNETAQVDEIFIVSPSRAIVLGSVSGTIRVANIVDLTSGSVIDFFYCHFPRVSKDGRYLAYVRFSPHFSPPSEWSYVYLVYDLALSPAENRLRRSEGFDDQVKVGIPVYPLENLQRGVYETTLTTEAEVHLLGSDGLFWLEDNVLAFVDRWRKVNRLVIVDVRSGVRQAKLQIKPIDTMAIVDLAQCGENREDPENLIYIQQIEIPKDRKGYVRLHLHEDACLRYLTLDIAIP